MSNMNGVLVIKCNLYLSPDAMVRLEEHIRNQRESGVIVLPSYCDAQIIPDDVEIRMES